MEGRKEKREKREGGREGEREIGRGKEGGRESEAGRDRDTEQEWKTNNSHVCQMLSLSLWHLDILGFNRCTL